MSCPICKRPTDEAIRPFCSQRCADIDLGRWLTGAYAIPSTDPDDALELDDGREQAARQADDDSDPDAGGGVH